MRPGPSTRTATKLAVVAGGLLALGPAQALATEVGCGATITRDTKLTHDVSACPAGGLVIGADDVTLDLNGHTVAAAGVAPDLDFGPDSTFGIDNRAGHAGVTIKNGSVRGFAAGVFLFGATNNRLLNVTVTSSKLPGIALIRSDDNRLEHVTASRNGVQTDFAGILMFASARNELRDSALTGNGDAGIFMPQSSDNRIDHNTISGNRAAGIESDVSDRNTVSRNHVFANGDDIQISGSDNTVTANVVSDAVGCADGCGFGISIDGGARNVVARNTVARTLRDGIRIAAFDPAQPSLDTVVRANEVRDANADGISVATDGDAPVTGTLLERNIAIGSGDDGFDVRSPLTTLTRNLATRNGDLGIFAVPGVTDGGGNSARANANPAQCTAITCRSSTGEASAPRGGVIDGNVHDQA
jgi:parallel beta-helix repeat protein